MAKRELYDPDLADQLVRRIKALPSGTRPVQQLSKAQIKARVASEIRRAFGRYVSRADIDRITKESGIGYTESELNKLAKPVSRMAKAKRPDSSSSDTDRSADSKPPANVGSKNGSIKSGNSLNRESVIDSLPTEEREAMLEKMARKFKPSNP